MLTKIQIALIKFMTNQQQHGVEIVYKKNLKKKNGVSNDQTQVSNDSNHKATTT